MRKKHLFYIIVLSVMLSVTLVGSALLSQVSASTRKATVTFCPDNYTWETFPPNPWKVCITVGWYTYQIVGSSIRVEGICAPVKTKNCWFVYYAYFDGNCVKSVLESKIGHDGGVEPGTYHVELTVTGNLKYGNTFRGTDIVTVTVPDMPPP